MALQKNIKSENGVISNYFRIASINQNYINLEPILDIYIYGYADEGFRETEKTLADKDIQKINFFKNYNIPLDDTKGYSRSNIYSRIKLEIPEFEGSIDV